MNTLLRIVIRHMLVFLLIAGQVAIGQVLPEDRFDILYHSYDGDEVKITGPSILFRKQVTRDISAFANYYVDNISSASIDVRSYASPYSEKRTEISVGGDMLVGETILSAGFTDSDEPDFEAQTAYFGVRQEIFGGMTTIRMGYSRGWDEVGNVEDPSFGEDIDRRSYRLGVSQVMTKNLIMNFDFEGMTDEGYLNNPYRQVRYAAAVPEGFLWQGEIYPETRTSTAFAVGGRYFVEQRQRSAIYGNVRIFNDTWGIDAFNILGGYTMATIDHWLFDMSYRYYSQSGADFYSDLFPFANAQNFLGRDKEISTYKNHTFRLGVTYDMPVMNINILTRGTVNFDLSYIYFDYDDFRNVPAGGPVGEEPLFDFGATVGQLYVSFWF